MQWWYRDRYRLTPNDPLFLGLTLEDLELEYWTAYYAAQAARGANISFDDEDENYNLDAILADLEQQETAMDSDQDSWETIIDEH